MVNEIGNPELAPGLKWHINGRYLTRGECLTHLVELRKERGRPFALSEEELQLSVEECHSLLSREMQADFDKIKARIAAITAPQAPTLRAIGFWLCAAAAGLSAPYLLKGGIAPSWLQWLLKGSGEGGDGTSWFTFGWLSLALALILYLRWRAVRLDTPGSRRLADTVSGAASVIMALGAIVFVAAFASTMLGLLVPLLRSVAPGSFSPYLQGLNREPGALWLAGVVTLIMGVPVALTFRNIRKQSPEAEFLASLSQAAWTGLAPSFLITMIAMTAFVSFALLLMPIGEWFPFIKSNESRVLTLAVFASAMAVPAVYTFRRVGWLGSDDKPTMTDAALTVFWILGSFILAIAATMLIVWVWHTASGYGVFQPPAHRPWTPPVQLR